MNTLFTLSREDWGYTNKVLIHKKRLEVISGSAPAIQPFPVGAQQHSYLGNAWDSADAVPLQKNGFVFGRP